jgi:hypothetical protein
VQYAVGGTLLEAGYVGSRGINLFRQVGINQAQLASPQHPIVNAVTGAAITTNTPANAALRAPFQGVSLSGFFQDQWRRNPSPFDASQRDAALLARRAVFWLPTRGPWRSTMRRGREAAPERGAR